MQLTNLLIILINLKYGWRKIKPKIIIRTSIGSQRPLHPQFQHIGDFTEAFKKMTTTIEIKIKRTKGYISAYKKHI